MDQHMIDPKNLPTWTVASFVLALLAVVVSMVGLYRANFTVAATQAQILKLNGKIDQLHPDQAQAPAAGASTPTP